MIAGTLSIYSFISLSLHHRRQKRAWIERELQKLSDAQTAFLRGEATAEQLHILEQERAGDEMQMQREKEKQNKKANSLWTKTKRMFYSIGGVKEEESLGEKARRGEFGVMDMVRQKETDANRLLTEGDGQVEITHQNGQGLGVVEMVEDHRRSGEKEVMARTELGQRGGMLDQLAENTASAASNSGRSWFSWGRGKN